MVPGNRTRYITRLEGQRGRRGILLEHQGGDGIRPRIYKPHAAEQCDDIMKRDWIGIRLEKQQGRKRIFRKHPESWGGCGICCTIKTPRAGGFGIKSRRESRSDDIHTKSIQLHYLTILRNTPSISFHTPELNQAAGLFFHGQPRFLHLSNLRSASSGQ